MNDERNEKLNLETLAAKVGVEFTSVDKRFNGVKNKIETVDGKLVELDAMIKQVVRLLIELNPESFDSKFHNKEERG